MLYDPALSPTLGRLRGMSERYRLRDPDEELDGLPGELHFDVLDPAGLEQPLVTNREALLVATAAGRPLLQAAGLELTCAAKAGDVDVYIFRLEDELSPETDDAEDEDTGYGRLHRAAALTVGDRHLPCALVSETRLVCFDDDTAASLTRAGLTRGVRDEGAPYGPAPESPWYIVTPAQLSKVARFDGAAPKDLRARYASGALPKRATFTQAKPKASKKVYDLAHSGFLILSPAALAVVDELGVEGERAPVDFLDVTGEPMKPADRVLFRAAPAELVDWEQSDVNRTGSGSVWGFRELELSAAALEEGAPALAHIPGTRLHLAHQRLVDAIEDAGLKGFELVPVSAYGYAWNLDDELTDWQL
jgi:hypothetical protein